MRSGHILVAVGKRRSFRGSVSIRLCHWCAFVMVYEGMIWGFCNGFASLLDEGKSRGEGRTYLYDPGHCIVIYCLIYETSKMTGIFFKLLGIHTDKNHRLVCVPQIPLACVLRQHCNVACVYDSDVWTRKCTSLNICDYLTYHTYSSACVYLCFRTSKTVQLCRTVT